jgi:hypothetical protein
MNENEPSVGDIIKGFPAFFTQYLLGFVWGGLCDVTLASLWLGSIALGLATSWELGAAAFFFGHFSIRTTNALGQAAVRAGREVRMPLGRIGNLLTPPPPVEAEAEETAPEPDKDQTSET